MSLFRAHQVGYSWVIRCEACPNSFPEVFSSLSHEAFCPQIFLTPVPEPLTLKPTRGELRSLLEVLVKKKRIVKQKPLSSPEGCPPTQGNTLKVGTYPMPSSAVEAGDSSRGANESTLKVLPISVWSPTSWGTAPPLIVPDEVTGNPDLSKAARDEESLISHAELAVGAVSSILLDFDLRRVGAFVHRGGSSSSSSGNHLCTSK